MDGIRRRWIPTSFGSEIAVDMLWKFDLRLFLTCISAFLMLYNLVNCSEVYVWSDVVKVSVVEEVLYRKQLICILNNTK